MNRYQKYGAGPQEARPLLWASLVDEEQFLLRRIHTYLNTICQGVVAKTSSSIPREPWAEVDEDPRGRVMVISGPRGSGKTTLLVTLVDQINKARNADTQRNDPDTLIASEIRPLGILDFDPLPKGVPLHAWLIQAWLPLVQYLEINSSRPRSGHLQCAPLREAWDGLFQQAVTAWTDVDDNRSMVDRLFDHRDQLRNYQELGRTWRDFVDCVLDRLAAIDSNAKVIVVPIDDVDLQVKKNIDLIHAMRLLRHPRVVYLLTADLEHARRIIFLDFLRQHRELQGDTSLSVVEDAQLAKDCRAISDALFEKAYPEMHVFRTEPVSITRLLDWRDGFLRGLLDDLQIYDTKIGEWLLTRAEGPTGSNECVMQWRGVQRLAEDVQNSAEEFQGVTTLKHILAQGDARGHVSIITDRGHGAVLDFELSGSLRVAAVPAWFTGLRNNRIIVGTQLVNTVMGPDRKLPLDAPTALLARELHEEAEDPVTGVLKSNTGRRGLVQADRLVLSIGSVLVWTRWTNAPRDAVFLWPFVRFPRIPTLRKWMREWNALSGVIRDTQNPDEKLLFAWLMCQLKWTNLHLIEHPDWKEKSIGDEAWANLFARIVDCSRTDRDFRLWFERSLPLFALPEFGLPYATQERLLAFVTAPISADKAIALQWLMTFESSVDKEGRLRRAERHQCAMNALYAVWDEEHDGNEPTDEDGDQILQQARRLYSDAPWYQFLVRNEPEKP